MTLKLDATSHDLTLRSFVTGRASTSLQLFAALMYGAVSGVSVNIVLETVVSLDVGDQLGQCQQTKQTH